MKKEVKIMYDLNRVTKEFNEACLKAGVTNTNPVKLNGRLTRTLGRVRWLEKEDGEIELIDIEFSKQLLETASDRSIRDVILHEAAHLIAFKRTGIQHGHDSYFKAICAELGTTNDKCSGYVETVKAVKYKYTIVCPNCGVLGGYNRMCKTVRNISACSCKKCNSNKLKVVML